MIWNLSKISYFSDNRDCCLFAQHLLQFWIKFFWVSFDFPLYFYFLEKNTTQLFRKISDFWDKKLRTVTRKNFLKTGWSDFWRFFNWVKPYIWFDWVKKWWKIGPSCFWEIVMSDGFWFLEILLKNWLLFCWTNIDL